MRVEAQNITIGFDRQPVLNGVDFVAQSGEMLGLIGPNGAGKTSLLYVLASLRAPQAGTVHYDGRTASQLGTRELGRRIAFLAQGGSVHWALRVETAVALGRLPHRSPFRGMSAIDRKAVERALRVTDTIALRQRTLMQVSGGERVRVMLARALAVEGEMLFADEPIAALDPLHQLEIMSLLRDNVKGGRGVVVVLHDLALAARFCDRLVLLAHGRVLADGPPELVLTDANLASAYGIEAIRGMHEGMPYLLPWTISETRRQRPQQPETQIGRS
jgi:iron complex transport system ATP-binding protein